MTSPLLTASAPFEHALRSDQFVTSGESAVGLEILRLDLRLEYQPLDTTEEILVNELAEQSWRIRRFRKLEAEMLNGELDLHQLTLVQRMMTAAERGFHRSLSALREIRKCRDAVSQESDVQVGFVPQISEEVEFAEYEEEEPYVHEQASEEDFTPEELARFAEIRAKLALRLEPQRVRTAAS